MFWYLNFHYHLEKEDFHYHLEKEDFYYHLEKEDWYLVKKNFFQLLFFEMLPHFFSFLIKLKMTVINIVKGIRNSIKVASIRIMFNVDKARVIE